MALTQEDAKMKEEKEYSSRIERGRGGETICVRRLREKKKIGKKFRGLEGLAISWGLERGHEGSFAKKRGIG